MENMNHHLNDENAEIKKAHLSKRRTQADRRESSEQKILMAAMELVADKGAYAVTLAEIGEKAGYSRGLPAHKFGTKSNLLKALAEYIAENFSVFSEMSSEPKLGIYRLEALINAHLLRKHERWQSARALVMLTTEAKLLDNDLSDYMAQYNRTVLSYLVKNINVAIAEKDLKAECDSAQAGLFLLSIFRGVTLLQMNDPYIDLQGLHTQAMDYLNTLRA